MHSIGTDEDVAPHFTVFQMESDAARILREARAFRTQADPVAERRGEHVQQVWTVDGEVRIAIALDRDLAEVEELPGLARVPQADFLARGLAGKRLERLADAKRVERACAVGTELQAGADFPQLRRLLVDLDLAALAQCRERGREPADAGTGDENLYVVSALMPAAAICSSSCDCTPDTPIAPTHSP